MFLVKLSLWCRDPGDNGHSSKKTLKEREILSILRIEERHINFYLVRYAASDMFSTRKLGHPVWLNSNRPEACFEWVGVAVTCMETSYRQCQLTMAKLSSVSGSSMIFPLYDVMYRYLFFQQLGAPQASIFQLIVRLPIELPSLCGAQMQAESLLMVRPGKS